MNKVKQSKNSKPSPFRDQFIQCEEDGMHKPGELQKFKDHPELLPAPWHRAARVIAEKLEEDPEFGLTPLMCLRFGGECSSANPECMRLRGWSAEDIEKRGQKWPTIKNMQ